MKEHITIGESKDNGKTVVFTCPHCEGWKRTFDTVAGTMKTENRNDITHIGAFSAMPDALSVTPPVRINKPNFCYN